MLTDLSLRVLGRLPADDCVEINESWWKLASRPPVKRPSAVCGEGGRVSLPGLFLAELLSGRCAQAEILLWKHTVFCCNTESPEIVGLGLLARQVFSGRYDRGTVCRLWP